jgi:hypothetical protein
LLKKKRMKIGRFFFNEKSWLALEEYIRAPYIAIYHIGEGGMKNIIVLFALLLITSCSSGSKPVLGDKGHGGGGHRGHGGGGHEGHGGHRGGDRGRGGDWDEDGNWYWYDDYDDDDNGGIWLEF